MRFFAVCLILGAAGLCYAETFGGAAFVRPWEETVTGTYVKVPESSALVRFFETQAILVCGYFIPWVSGTLGIGLLLHRWSNSGR